MKTFWIFFSAAMFAISGRASEWPGELRPVNGALTLHIDGKAVNASAFRWLTSFGSLDRLYHQEKNAPMAQFAQTRVPVIIIQIDIGWKGPDKYDYSEVDKVLKKLFKDYPDAYIIPDLHFELITWYSAAHPETAFTILENGKLHPMGGVITASFNSSRFEADAKTALTNLVAHFKNQGYAQRTLGFQINYGATAEWRYWDQDLQRPDWNPESIAAWRNFLRKKYGNILNLNKSWNTRHVEFKEILPPPGSFVSVYRAGYLCDPADDRIVRDYNQFVEENISKLRLSLADHVKKLTDNRALVGAYYSTLAEDPEPGKGLDFLVSSSIYVDRAAGGVTLPQPLGLEFMRRQGIFYWHDADMRTYLWPDEKWGVAQNLYESVMMMRREFLSLFIAGAGNTWFSLHHHRNVYGNVALLRTIAELESIAAAAIRMNYDRKSTAEVAVVYPRASRTAFWGNSCYMSNYVRTGTAVDFFPDNHLELIDPDQYRLLIFAGIPWIDDAGRKHIERFKKNRHSILFLYGTGLETADALSTEAAGTLTGFTFELSPGIDRKEITETAFRSVFGESRPSLGKNSGPAGALRMTVIPKKNDEIIFRAADGKVLFARHRYPDWNAWYYHNYQAHTDLFRKVIQDAGIKVNFPYDSAFFQRNRNFWLIGSTEGESLLLDVGNVPCVLDVFHDRILPLKDGQVSLTLRRFETCLLLTDTPERIAEFRRLRKEETAKRPIQMPEVQTTLEINPADAVFHVMPGHPRKVELKIHSEDSRKNVLLNIRMPEGFQCLATPRNFSLQNGEMRTMNITISAKSANLEGKGTIRLISAGKIIAEKNIALRSNDFLYLSDLPFRSGTTGWGDISRDMDCSRQRLRVGSRNFDKGIGAHAFSELVYALEERKWKELTGAVGVSGWLKSGNQYASCRFKILADGRQVFDSGILKSGGNAVPFRIDLTGVQIVKLIAEDGGDGSVGDHANWCDVRLHPLRK